MKTAFSKAKSQSTMLFIWIIFIILMKVSKVIEMKTITVVPSVGGVFMGCRGSSAEYY